MFEMIKDAWKFARTAPRKDVFITLIAGIVFGICLMLIFELLLMTLAISHTSS